MKKLGIVSYESRRKSRRYRPSKKMDLEFMVFDYKGKIPGNVIDISKGGLAFTSPVRLEEILKTEKEIIIILNRVCYLVQVRRIDNKRNVCGCEFIKKLR